LPIERHINLEATPGEDSTLEAGVMRWLAWIEGRTTCFGSVTVLREQAPSRRLRVILRFESQAAGDSWATSVEHEEWAREIVPVLGDVTAAFYEVVA
jgi:hypothetical protein